MNQALTPTHFRKLPAEAGEETEWGAGAEAGEETEWGAGAEVEDEAWGLAAWWWGEVEAVGAGLGCSCDDGFVDGFADWREADEA